MNLSRLPVYRWNQFWQVLAVPARRLLLGLAVVAVLLAGLWVFNYYVPMTWCMDVKAVPQSNSEQVVMDVVSRDYHQMNLLALASYSYVNFIASVIQPSMTLALLLAIALSVGWSMLLASASRIEGFAGYVIYFFHACFLYFSDFGLLWGGIEYRMLIASGVILPFIIFAYLFRSRSIAWSIPIQFIFFVVLHAGLYTGAHVFDPLAGLYQTVTFGIPVLLTLALLYTLFISKELTTAIVFWATNRNDITKRKGSGFVFGISLVLFVLQAVVTARELNWISIPSYFFLRPMHFWLISAGISLFLSQNWYERMKNVFTAPIAFYGMQVGWMIVALGVMMFVQGSLEYSLLREWHQNIGVLLTVGMFFHIIFLLANYAKVIAKKFNAYSLLMLPKTIGIEAVLFSTIAIFILIQGNESWRGLRSWVCTFRNMQGDVELLRQNQNDARNYYKMSSDYYGGDVKSNFNLAALFIAEGKHLTSIDTANMISACYNESLLRFAFEPALLNQAHFYNLMGQPQAAIARYEEVLKKYNFPLGYANLAGLYFQENRPDPAILALKKGISANPNQAELYSNLALIYLRYNRKKEAQEFAQAAYDLAPDNPNVLENYYFMRYYLGDRKELPFDDKLKDEPEYYLANLNKAIVACTRNDYQWANKTVSALLKRNITPEVAFLRMTTQAMLDSIPNAESRLKWIMESYPEYRAVAFHNIAVSYFSKGAPEMALGYFDQSAKAGIRYNAYNAAKMLLVAGNHMTGYNLMKNLRDSLPEIKTEITHELSLLEYGYEYEKQHLEWDLTGITYDEAMRGGLYAFAHNQDILKVEELYRPLVDTDSSVTAPYYEIALMYLTKGQTKMARESLKWGLKRKPDDVLLNVAFARCDWLDNKTEDARNRLSEVKEPDQPEVLLLSAQIAEKSKQYPDAERFYRRAVAKNPFFKPAYLGLTQLLMAQKKYKDGVDLLGKALEYNDRTDLYWFYFGECNKMLGSYDWATDAYQKAISNSANDANTNRFADTLKAVEGRFLETKSE